MPEPILVSTQTQPSVNRYWREGFNGAGQNSFDLPPGQNQEMFELLLNTLPPVTGSLCRRWGYKKWAQAPVQRLAEYQSDVSGKRYILTLDAPNVAAFNEDGTTAKDPVYTPAEGSAGLRMTTSRDYAYFIDPGANEAKKWNGDATVSKWGIAPPVLAPAVGSKGTGNITLSLGGRCYYLIFKNPVTGHYSDLSPISANTGNVTDGQFPLTNLEVSTDPQVTKKTILATGDGGDPTTLFELAEIANSDTSYTDNIDEETLQTKNVFLETNDYGDEIGVSGNLPPDVGSHVIKHKGRLFMLKGQFLRCSKSLDEVVTSTGMVCGRYEECWPAEYELDISEGAETPRGLLSDGEVLYIGTERHIRKLYGNGPNDFQNPQTAFNEVGIVNQDVWKVVFAEGTPAGAMWLTPDLRVIASDFNTYKDVGTPIQDVLNRINVAALDTCHAIYWGNGTYAFYQLFIPVDAATTPNLVCTYSVRDQRWFLWDLGKPVTASLYTIRADGEVSVIFNSGTQLYALDPTSHLDDGSAIPVTVRTVWLSMGDPSVRKLLNEIEVLTEDATALRIKIEGANRSEHFETPVTIVANGTLKANTFSDWKLYLAALNTAYRYFRITFSSTSSVETVLDGFNLEVIVGHRI